ncbi:alpha/beta fold hydrolase [Desulfoluna spongiiphila]|uniref:Lysophospholipase n=1 Tax=Desulfoluna spongiiphila TaxID=419481 RepID=A0A1G5IRR8_9BACT|nr:alpha/beta fold hydrolase [Desulfoluna spongiiphila]SCY78461.1 lysophospholipase [Desulfoluna spongiiphila]
MNHRVSRLCAILLLVGALFTFAGCNDVFDIDTQEEVARHRVYYRSTVMPYFETGEEGYFTGIDGVDIAYRAFSTDSSKGAIVVFHGKSENLTKYAEFVYDMKDMGYAIYLLDHRGHGASGRLLADPMKVYVKDFDDYVEDANNLISNIVQRRDGHETLFLVAHSMGGAIGSLYLEKYPRVFDGAVLCAPMQGINTEDFIKMSDEAGYALALGNVVAGKGKEYGLKQEAPEDFGQDVGYEEGQARFFAEAVTHSYKRWLVNEEYLSERPELLAGGAIIGVTWRWLEEGYAAIFKLRRNAWKITTPLMLFEAVDDHFTTSEGHETFASRLRPGVLREYVRFDSDINGEHPAYHEILCEEDAIRNQAIAKIKTFITSFE